MHSDNNAEEEPAARQEQYIFSPSAILNIYNQAISVKTERRPIHIRGILEKRNDRNYGGFIYNRLKDEACDQYITLKTSEEWHRKLHDKQIIQLHGFLTRNINTKRGSLDIHLNILHVTDLPDIPKPEKNLKRIKLLGEKAQSGMKDMDGLIRAKIIRNEPVMIRVITGKTGVIDEDIRKAIGSEAILYNIDYRKISIESPSQIIHALAELDKAGADIICVSRGGGDLETFEDENIGSQVLITKAIVGSAIGHASDVSLFELLADKKFSTPTAFGNYLRSIYEKVLLEIETAKKEMNETMNNVQYAQLKKMQQSITEMEARELARNKLLQENSMILKAYESKLKITSRNNKILFITTIILSILLALLNFT
jgi:exodeoxyribonuclease VII large subunit